MIHHREPVKAVLLDPNRLRFDSVKDIGLGVDVGG